MNDIPKVGQFIIDEHRELKRRPAPLRRSFGKEPNELYWGAEQEKITTT